MQENIEAPLSAWAIVCPDFRKPQYKSQGLEWLHTLRRTMIPSKFFFTSLAFVAAIPVAEAASFILPRAVTNTSKAGLAWPNANTVDFKQFQTTGKVSWCVNIRMILTSLSFSLLRYYTWSVWPTDSDLEFSPLLWGAKSVTEFNSKISDVLKRTQPKVTAVLGMNE